MKFGSVTVLTLSLAFAGAFAQDASVAPGSDTDRCVHWMKATVPRTLNLATLTIPWAEGCPGPSPNYDVRELHFGYGKADLFVCIRPEQTVRGQEAKLSER
jgi:hypothetical protein